MWRMWLCGYDRILIFFFLKHRSYFLIWNTHRDAHRHTDTDTDTDTDRQTDRQTDRHAHTHTSWRFSLSFFFYIFPMLKLSS